MTQTSSSSAWNEWLDAHAEWRRAATDLVRGRADSLRPAPTPPEGELPDDRALTLRVAAAASELAQLRNQAAHRVSGELQAAHAYRTAAR